MEPVMKTRNLLLTSVLTIAVFGLLGAVLTSSLFPSTASAGGLIAGHLSSGHMPHGTRGGGRHAWSHGCDGTDARMIELASTWVSMSLDLTDDQEAELQPVLKVLADWHDEANVFCEPERLATAPDALRGVSSLLESSQRSMAELIPAFDAFYAALTSEQRAQLNAFIAEHHGHRA
jgi:hypothetical protein